MRILQSNNGRQAIDRAIALSRASHAALLASMARGGMIAGWNESNAAGVMIRVTKGILSGIGGLWAAAWSTAAMAQDSLSNANPEGSGVLVRAVQWLQGTLLGTIATVVAVIAVASVGFLMLTGRINWRYGATVILGCFILFGAASIVAGIQSTASYGN
jgi:type IV secretion system protein VirB2